MLSVDPGAPAPPYEQIRRQLIEQISSGELQPGAKLPAVRRLASDLGLAPNTVARTYRELEMAGYVQTRGRNGTIVTGLAGAESDVHRQATQLSTEYATNMLRLGLDRDDIIGYLHRAFER